MDELDYWRLCDELTIAQAALLLVGDDPKYAPVVEALNIDRRPPGYDAMKQAILTAVRLGSIDSDVERQDTYDGPHDEWPSGSEPIREKVDAIRTSIRVASLKQWLKSRGKTTGFFFPAGVTDAEYLDPSHPRFAPKLAAAVSAWQAVTEAPGRSPKSALQKWLRQHAGQYGMTNDDGTLNETAIEEVSKVANWQLKGGAPATPGANPPTPESPEDLPF